MTMTLHYAPGTIAAATAITLYEAGIEFDAVRVDFSKGEQLGTNYRAVNSKGRVPALVTDKGVLTETIALLEYIAAQVPDAGLVPEDAFDAARMRSVMSYLASTMHVNHAHRMRGSRWADLETSWADMQGKVAETMTASAAFVEAEALDGPFVIGDQLTLADPYLYVVSLWLEGDGVAVSDFPKLAAFQAMMHARPAVRKAVADGFL